MYKAQDQEEYKTTSIRMKKSYYEILKSIAFEDKRSTNYLINKILIDYIINEEIKKEINIFGDI
jgi:predicted DNA-binding ribbon-helix-helix protein